MKKFKALVSIIVTAVLLLSCISTVWAAQTEYPVVFLAGFTSSRMYVNRGQENEMCVWKQDIADKVIAAVKTELPGVLLGAGLAGVGSYDKLFDTLEPYVNEVLEYLKMNDDGSSVYDVEVYPHSVETTRLDKLKETAYYPDYSSLKVLGTAAGDKNVYCCTLDWRKGQLDNAEVVNEYINEVLRVTGSRKVNLMGVSFGGQVAASYLAIYGGDKVNNVVLRCPALDGTSIVSKLLNGGNYTVAWSDAMKLYCYFDNIEDDYSMITDVIEPELIMPLLRSFVDRFLLDFFINFPSIWDLVPLKDYEALRDKYISDDAHTQLREKTEKYHKEISSNIGSILRNLHDDGVDISIVAGYGSDLAVECGITSDGVIDLASATGASAAPLGGGMNVAPTADGYVSPDGTVDAYTAYLPENTWFVEGLYHSLDVEEKGISNLLTTLLLTENINNVHSSKDYPRYLSTKHHCAGVALSFSNCSPCFFTPYSTKLTVENLSSKYSVTIDKITCESAGLSFGSHRITLMPGEKVTVDVGGKLPERDLDSLSVNVDYVMHKDNYSIEKTRIQYFRYTCGAMYDEVLDDSITADSPTVESVNTDSKYEINIRIFFTRLFAFIYRIITKLSLFNK